MVESGGLENRCRGNPSTEGSNPSPSADAGYANRFAALRDRQLGAAANPLVYQGGGTLTSLMATAKSRIQVTVDDELASAMSRIDPCPASRSGLVRDLALRGAQALEEERARAGESLTVLLEIADGKRDYDLGAAADVAARRSDRLP